MTHFDLNYYMSCYKKNCKYMFTNRCDKCIHNASTKEDNYELISDLDIKPNENTSDNDEIKLHDKVKIIKGDFNYINAIGHVIIIDNISFGGKTKYLIDFRANKNQSVGYDDYNNYCVWFNREDIIKI